MRALITGASGSGTTTLGMAIATKMGWKFIDADDYFWLPTKPPYKQRRDRTSRLAMILAELGRHESSVVSGSVMGWGSQLEDSFDLIAFLYLDTAIRVERLRTREMEELGYADPEFLQWASEYDTGPSAGRSLSKHREWLSKKKCKMLHVEGDLTVQQRCELLIGALPDKPLQRTPLSSSVIRSDHVE